MFTSTHRPRFTNSFVLDLGNPLNWLVYESQRLQGVSSLMLANLDTFFGMPDLFDQDDFDDEHPNPIPLDNEKAQDLAALQKLPKWHVVMDIIAIHCDIASAKDSGLFGLLGDAWVQIVEASDVARVNAFFALAESCDQDKPLIESLQSLQESADSMKRRLKGVIIRQFRSKELAAKMRPAIMFRLCTRKCNEAIPEHRSVRNAPVRGVSSPRGGRWH